MQGAATGAMSVELPLNAPLLFLLLLPLLLLLLLVHSAPCPASLGVVKFTQIDKVRCACVQAHACRHVRAVVRGPMPAPSKRAE